MIFRITILKLMVILRIRRRKRHWRRPATTALRPYCRLRCATSACIEWTAARLRSDHRRAVSHAITTRVRQRPPPNQATEAASEVAGQRPTFHGAAPVTDTATTRLQPELGANRVHGIYLLPAEELHGLGLPHPVLIHGDSLCVRLPAEVSVGCCGGVNRVLEPEPPDD